MRVAFFPKNPQEAALFSSEFKNQRVEFDIYGPSDVWLAQRESIITGAGPELAIPDINAPAIQDKAFTDFDLIFQRSVSSWKRIHGQQVVQFFFDVLSLAETTTPVVNPIASTVLAARKHLALSHLSRRGIPTLPFFASPNPIRNIRITNTIHPPTILKTLEGAGGIGVVLAPDQAVLGDVLSLFFKNQQVPIIQPYIPAPDDLRVLVLGQQVIGAIRRTGKIHKHNISLGATAHYVSPNSLPHALLENAAKATEVLGLAIAGLDFLNDDGTFYLLDANPSPGFKGFGAASKMNLPQAIVRFLIESYRR
jgi:RimK family alpha-L-glutamate ligase